MPGLVAVDRDLCYPNPHEITRGLLRKCSGSRDRPPERPPEGAMIFRSPYPDVTIPETMVTTHVLRLAEELAGKTALVDGTTGATTSYGELAGSIRRVAGGLAARGF